MISWLRKLFHKREDSRDATMRKLAKAIPDELIKQLAAAIAGKQEEECRTQGYWLSGTERTKLETEIEYRLRNPGEHRGPIPVRVQALYGDIVARNSERYSSSASSPVG